MDNLFKDSEKKLPEGSIKLELFELMANGYAS
jgi:hypothetical protein